MIDGKTEGEARKGGGVMFEQEIDQFIDASTFIDNSESGVWKMLDCR